MEISDRTAHERAAVALCPGITSLSYRIRTRMAGEAEKGLSGEKQKKKKLKTSPSPYRGGISDSSPRIFSPFSAAAGFFFFIQMTFCYDLPRRHLTCIQDDTFDRNDRCLGKFVVRRFRNGILRGHLSGL